MSTTKTVFKLPYTPADGATAALVPVEMLDGNTGPTTIAPGEYLLSIEPPLAPGDTVGWEVSGNYAMGYDPDHNYTEGQPKETRTAAAVHPVRLGDVTFEQCANCIGVKYQQAHDIIEGHPEAATLWFVTENHPTADTSPSSWWWLIELQS